MAKTTAERMSAYRKRLRIAGMTNLSLLVPEEGAALFQEFAAARRRLKAGAIARTPLRKHWFSVIEQRQAGAETKPADKNTTDARARSRAEILAEQILKQIIRLGWPTGRLSVPKRS